MTKALLKKQMMEAFSWLYKDKKSGKIRNLQGILVYGLLYLVLFGVLGVTFYKVGAFLCEPLAGAGLGWLYWCLMGLMGLFMGVFGSVFNTYSALYQARDNDLLLSMPIPPSRILLARLSGVYVMGLMYELMVMIPAVLAWFLYGTVTPVGVFCSLMIPLVLSVLILALSCMVGWVVALAAGKLKRKNIATVAVSILFIVGYYYVYGKAYAMLQNVLLFADSFGDKMKTAAYPLYQMGLAAEGNLLSLAIFTAMVGVLMALVYLVMERSFLRLSTVGGTAAKAKYRAKKLRTSSVGGALLKKELRRFAGSANYMLNCGLGVIMMPVAAVVLILKRELILPLFTELLSPELGGLVGAGAVCLMCTMNDMAAASVSLEGRNLWIVQSMPIPGKKALMAKLHAALLLTLIPAALPVIAVEWLLQPSLLYGLLLPVLVCGFVVMMTALDLTVNLKLPNLTWTSEIVPIKQSAAVSIALFGGMALVGVAGVMYYLLRKVLSPLGFLLILCVLLWGMSGAVLRWLTTRGAEIYERL